MSSIWHCEHGQKPNTPGVRNDAKSLDSLTELIKHTTLPPETSRKYPTIILNYVPNCDVNILYKFIIRSATIYTTDSSQRSCCYPWTLTHLSLLWHGYSQQSTRNCRIKSKWYPRLGVISVKCISCCVYIIRIGFLYGDAVLRFSRILGSSGTTQQKRSGRDFDRAIYAMKRLHEVLNSKLLLQFRKWCALKKVALSRQACDLLKDMNNSFSATE